MAIQVLCPHCKARLTMPEEHLGKRGRCPKCRQALTVAASPQTAQTIERPASRFPLALVAAGIMLLVLLAGAAGIAGMFLLRPDSDKAHAATTPNADKSDTRSGTDPKSTDNRPDEPPFTILPEPDPDLQPVTLMRPRRLSLPAVAADLVVGGAGKYLIVHLPTLRKAAVVDVPRMQIQHFIPLRSEKTRIAAGRTAVVVANFETRKLQRWRLDREEMELQVDLPADHPGTGLLAMGSGSYGPILLGPGPKFLDLHTLKPIALPLRHSSNGELPTADAGMGVRVSADGQVFGFWKRGPRPQQAFSLINTGSEVVGYTSGESAGHVAPGGDGQTLYAARGRFTNKAESITVKHLNLEYSVPSAQPGFWFVVRELRVNRSPIQLHVEGDDRPFATLTDIEHPGANEWDDEDFCTDRKMVYLPFYHLFVTLPRADQLQFHPVDLADLTAKSAVNYLTVLSQPPPQVSRGQTLHYTVRARSRADSIVHRLESGPPGMAITPEGLLTWTVPRDYGSDLATGAISLQDAAGLKRTQRFTLRVVRAGP